MKCSNERFFQGLSTRVDTSKSLYARRQRERCADFFAPSTELFIFFSERHEMSASVMTCFVMSHVALMLAGECMGGRAWCETAVTLKMLDCR